MNLTKLAALFGAVSLFAAVAGCAAEPTDDDVASTSNALVENDEAQNVALAGPCSAQNVCVYWGQNVDGAHASLGLTVWDHSAYRYPNNGSGAGQVVGNNGGSFTNAFWDHSVTVFYNPSRNGERPSGPNMYLAPNETKNCAQAGPNICNNNRAHFPN
ncbi:hypothetical protein LVJ94_26330 [Pendulispora rubella]|uniref:Peptidase inhibitor family I36 n=1 Tax=Pendulispora rubella TaxID=2741070 RepID=A0ABZ2KP43_9BACT